MLSVETQWRQRAQRIAAQRNTPIVSPGAGTMAEQSALCSTPLHAVHSGALDASAPIPRRWRRGILRISLLDQRNQAARMRLSALSTPQLHPRSPRLAHTHSSTVVHRVAITVRTPALCSDASRLSAAPLCRLLSLGSRGTQLVWCESSAVRTDGRGVAVSV